MVECIMTVHQVFDQTLIQVSCDDIKNKRLLPVGRVVVESFEVIIQKGSFVVNLVDLKLAVENLVRDLLCYVLWKWLGHGRVHKAFFDLFCLIFSEKGASFQAEADTRVEVGGCFFAPLGKGMRRSSLVFLPNMSQKLGCSNKILVTL